MKTFDLEKLVSINTLSARKSLDYVYKELETKKNWLTGKVKIITEPGVYETNIWHFEDEFICDLENFQDSFLASEHFISEDKKIFVKSRNVFNFVDGSKLTKYHNTLAEAYVEREEIKELKKTNWIEE
jgi:hypothetical protein